MCFSYSHTLDGSMNKPDVLKTALQGCHCYWDCLADKNNLQNRGKMKTRFTCLYICQAAFLSFSFSFPSFKMHPKFTHLNDFLPSPLMTPNSWPFHASISLCSIYSNLALFHPFACVCSWGFTSQHQQEPEDTAEQMVELLLAQPCCCPVAFCFCTRKWLPACQLWL